MLSKIGIFISILSILFVAPLYGEENSDNDNVLIVKETTEVKTLIENDVLEVVEEFESIESVAIKTSSAETINSLKSKKENTIEDNIPFKISNSELANDDLENEVKHNLNMTGIENAWLEGLTGKNINIAIIDTGISLHDDLQIKSGYSTVNYTDKWYDDNGHGTHVAGIVAAKRNDLGTVGVAYDAQIHSVKAMDENGDGTLSDILEAMDWAILNEMDIINLSLGTEFYSVHLEDMIKKAYHNGILIIAASGNAGEESEVRYPAKFEEVIAVSSVDQNSLISSYSSRGTEIEFSAPGELIESTNNNNSYSLASGTSQATPHVTGFLSLLKQKYPNKTHTELRKQLQQYVIDLGEKDRDSLYGYGLVNYPSNEDTYINPYFKVGDIASEITDVSNNIRIGELKEHQVFQADSIENDYYKIKIGNTHGKISKENIKESSKDLILDKFKQTDQKNYKIELTKDTEVFSEDSKNIASIAVLQKGLVLEVYNFDDQYWIMELAGRSALVNRTHTRILFSDEDEYMKVNEDVSVFLRKNGSLIEVSKLKSGQVYPRYEASEKWHRIQYGNQMAFVKKDNTEPVSEASFKNRNTQYDINNLKISFTANENVVIYDNSGGSLVPFGMVRSGEVYPIAYDYGGKWIYVVYGDRVGFVDSSKVRRAFTTNDKFMKTLENVSVFLKRDGQLIEVSQLVEGRVYPRYEASSQWHQIQYGTEKAFVRKKGTIPAEGRSLNNINKQYEITKINRTFKAISDVAIYDNSGAGLVPFATIKAGESYTIAHDYGGSWIYVVYGDLVGFVARKAVQIDFDKDDQYFKALGAQPVYLKRNGKLEEVSRLVDGEIYPRYDASPNWHQIQYGFTKAYVKKENTIPINSKKISNENDRIKLTQYQRSFVTNKSINVYDNSTSSLIPFATINAGERYIIARDYGGRWVYVIYANRIGFVNTQDIN